MAYEGHCGSCANFEEQNSDKLYDVGNAYYVKGFCTWYHCFYYPDDSCRDHYRSRTSSGDGCFITAMVCDVLGFDDDCEVMETLRNFRGNVLQKNNQYRDLLFEYDYVGPKIAQNIRFEDIDFVTALYQGFLQPITHFIKMQKEEKAVEQYKKMTRLLEELYCISFDGNVPLEYDMSVGGHGNKKLVIRKDNL